ncbi:MAG: hypothetical protein KTR24_06540, partial [Saprospiraceae bacterium]|nr:hypothetical protein [Saprospiraceae bacterium]
MNNLQDFILRQHSSAALFTMALVTLCLCIPANVAHSLPSFGDFNTSLNEDGDADAMASYQVKTVVLDAGHGGK